MTYEEIRDYLNHKNPFPNKLGVVITEIRGRICHRRGAGTGLYDQRRILGARRNAVHPVRYHLRCGRRFLSV